MNSEEPIENEKIRFNKLKKFIWIYQKLYMERLRLSFYINDIATFSSIKVERGLNYPFARTMSFSLNATF